MLFLMFIALTAALAGTAGAQVTEQRAVSTTDSLSVERIFGGRDLSPAPMPHPVWLANSRAYLELRTAEGGGTDIVRVDAKSGQETVIVPAARLVDEDGRRFSVEDMQLSPDESRALLFHNSVRVWRANTRGVYHVVELSTGKLTPLVTVTSPVRTPSTLTDTATANFLGKVAGFVVPPLRNGLQMFAKFAPDSRHVAFVRDNDLYVTNLEDGSITRLTSDGSTDVINGTTDWVYEEELGLRDAFRWSPDSKSIAYWRFDQSPVPAFPMVDQQTLYPTVSVLRYPKAGMPNSRVRVGVISAMGGATTWLAAGPDTGQYIARMEWLGNDSIAVRRLPRKQDRMDLLLLSAATGQGRLVASDSDAAYVDVDDNGVVWIDDGARFLMMSDRSGWRQVYLYDRAGNVVRQVTQDGHDVLDIVTVDEDEREVYVVAAAPTPIQRQVLRYPLDGKSPAEQITVGEGTHSVSFNPAMTAMLDVYSSGGKPPVATLYEYPSMKVRRVLVDNAELTEKLAAAGLTRPQFFKVPMPDGTLLDAYRLIPASFDSTEAHPVLMYVYGGPAAPQVNDAWGGTRYLWHQLLTRHGYVIVVVDNRGAAWRGRDFRKVTQYHLGLRESQDQMDAARWIGNRSWADSARIGIWGWSYGGYMTLMTAGRGGDLFKAAVCVAPVSDWHLYDTIYTERFMWTPQKNPDGYRTSSAQAHLDGLTAHFLIVHGTGDDNVHPQNTMQVVNELEARAFPFQMMLYPNRTHSISGGRTQVHLFNMLTSFILANL